MFHAVVTPVGTGGSSHAVAGEYRHPACSRLMRLPGTNRPDGTAYKRNVREGTVTMTIKITPNDKGNPPGKLADAELHFTEGRSKG